MIFKKKRTIPAAGPAVPKAAAEPVEHSVKELISRYKADPSVNAPLLSIIQSFQGSIFWVPMSIEPSAEDLETLKNVKQGDQIQLKSPLHMKPDILKGGNGGLFFPVFTSSEESPENYRSRFSWVQMSGKQVLEFCAARTDLEGLVINAFSDPLTLTRQAMDLAEKRVVDHVLEAGTQVILSNLNHTVRPLKDLMINEFKKNRTINKAFMALMQQKGEQSFLIVIDGQVPDPSAFIADLNAKLQPLKPVRPLDYVMFPAMKEQLREQGIAPFYYNSFTSHPYRQERLEDTGLFQISEFRDKDGWTLSYSLDFERADDCHYQICADEAARLTQKLRQTLQTEETDFIKLVQLYLSPVLQEPALIENAVRKMLADGNIRYQFFAYD